MKKEEECFAYKLWIFLGIHSIYFGCSTKGHKSDYFQYLLNGIELKRDEYRSYMK